MNTGLLAATPAGYAVQQQQVQQQQQIQQHQHQHQHQQHHHQQQHQQQHYQQHYQQQQQQQQQPHDPRRFWQAAVHIAKLSKSADEFRKHASNLQRLPPGEALESALLANKKKFLLVDPVFYGLELPTDPLMASSGHAFDGPVLACAARLHRRQRGTCSDACQDLVQHCRNSHTFLSLKFGDPDHPITTAGKVLIFVMYLVWHVLGQYFFLSVLGGGGSAGCAVVGLREPQSHITEMQACTKTATVDGSAYSCPREQEADTYWSYPVVQYTGGRKAGDDQLPRCLGPTCMYEVRCKIDPNDKGIHRVGYVESYAGCPNATCQRVGDGMATGPFKVPFIPSCGEVCPSGATNESNRCWKPMSGADKCREYDHWVMWGLAATFGMPALKFVIINMPAQTVAKKGIGRLLACPCMLGKEKRCFGSCCKGLGLACACMCSTLTAMILMVTVLVGLESVNESTRMLMSLAMSVYSVLLSEIKWFAMTGIVAYNPLLTKGIRVLTIGRWNADRNHFLDMMQQAGQARQMLPVQQHNQQQPMMVAVSQQQSMVMVPTQPMAQQPMMMVQQQPMMNQMVQQVHQQPRR